MSPFDPLAGPPPPEVPLPRSPLVRVLAQVRFPLVIAIEQRDFASPFQLAIRDQYPVLRPEQTQSVLLGPQGATQTAPQTVWRFTDVDGLWRVSLAPDFLAIETTKYRSREDFLTRLHDVVSALQNCVGPKVVDRFGVRYIDRITGPAIDQISRLVRDEVRGIAGTEISKQAEHSLTESLFSVGEAKLLARWGFLPPNGTHDPMALEPMSERSWILDLDMFITGPKPFEVAAIDADARASAERAYSFFRWAVTDDFLRQYGGSL